VRHYDAAQRPCQIASSKDAEGLELAQPVGNIRREEEIADDDGEEDKDDEVIELQRATQRRQRQCLEVLPGQGSGRSRDRIQHILMFPIAF